jgi:hypothetical protein
LQQLGQQQGHGVMPVPVPGLDPAYHSGTSPGAGLVPGAGATPGTSTTPNMGPSLGQGRMFVDPMPASGLRPPPGMPGSFGGPG